MTAVCVFCASAPGRSPAYAEAASAFGALLAGRSLTVVYGGGRAGLMGALADGALAAGGTVVGLIPQFLVDREVAHTGVSELVVVGSMHERKLGMAQRADAFVALPGGLGTLEELVEAWTWTQLGLQRKPIGLLDVEGYWRPFLAMIEAGVGAGFIPRGSLERLVVDDDPERLVARLV